MKALVSKTGRAVRLSRVRISPSPPFYRSAGNSDYTKRSGSVYNGEVSEWPKERDRKSRSCRKVARGFESHPLRFYSIEGFEGRAPAALGIPRLPRWQPLQEQFSKCIVDCPYAVTRRVPTREGESGRPVVISEGRPLRGKPQVSPLGRTRSLDDRSDALVAQLDRASACGAEGSEFKSRRARYFL